MKIRHEGRYDKTKQKGGKAVWCNYCDRCLVKKGMKCRACGKFGNEHKTRRSKKYIPEIELDNEK